MYKSALATYQLQQRAAELLLIQAENCDHCSHRDIHRHSDNQPFTPKYILALEIYR